MGLKVMVAPVTPFPLFGKKVPKFNKIAKHKTERRKKLDERGLKFSSTVRRQNGLIVHNFPNYPHTRRASNKNRISLNSMSKLNRVGRIK